MELRDQLAEALGDRYRVERELGTGGMAVVFLAQDLKHHRRVAIKVLKPQLAAALGSDRFLREIEIAASLQHPNIVPLYDSGQAGELLYYVMPFIEGESLRERLARDQQLPIPEALHITREVGEALQYAHDHGVIHRDIKPENIMLAGGHAVVADFGIARALQAAGASQLTLSGMVVGTPLYMSPEQGGGQAVDGRSDQYSLACTLYEMLLGQPPFTGPSLQAVIARHSVDPVPGLRVVRQTVSPVVEGSILQAMAKLPADRFATIRQFLDALERPASSRGRFRLPIDVRLVTTLGAVAVIAVVTWWLVAVRSVGRSRVRAVAVLPFAEAGSGDSAFLGKGMTEGLIADLGQIGSLKVISRSSEAPTMGAAQGLTLMAGQLGVDAVVQGTIRSAGDSVHVNVQLLHVQDSAVLFTHNYEARLGELPNLQRVITVAISGAIKADVKRVERRRLEVRHEVAQRAYEAYLRGRVYLENDEPERARTQFEQASNLAPDWAPPYVGLANYYTALPFYTDIPPAEVLPKARAALAQALTLDEGLAEAHAANAYIRAYYEWDWRAAEQEFRRALELQPSYPDAYFSYSRFLASRRRLEEAIAQLNRAVELDPLSLSLQANRALLDYFAGRYDEANRRLREVLKSDSTNGLAQWALALVLEQQGKAGEAIAILEPISASGWNRRSSLGHAYGVSGKTERARGVLGALRAAAARQYVPAYWFAVVYAGLGERDQALRALERAYEERSTVLAYVLIDPRLAPLRTDPRFQALAGRLGAE